MIRLVVELAVGREYDGYTCIDTSNSKNTHMIGWGDTQIDAIKNWIELYEEQEDSHA